jgi:serine/threonine protein kinase
MASVKSAKKATIHDLKFAPTADLLATAADVVDSQCLHSHLFDAGLESRIPRFDKTELHLGKILGRGGFCVVVEISKIKTNEATDDKSSGSKASLSTRLMRIVKRKMSKKAQLQEESFRSGVASTLDDVLVPGQNSEPFCRFDTKFSRDFIARTSKKRHGGRYVIKQLSPELKETDKITFLKGTVDLAMEAKFLSTIDHPNIIELCGVSRIGPCTEGYFLVLERIHETLSKRIKKWMDIDRTCKGITGVFAGSKNKILDLRRERYEAAFSICSGAGYLHQKNIIFRDLKPDNIGFDSNGVLKIMDFGLAKELKKEDKTEDGLYRLTGFTGALRYMAPEVGLSQPYNLAADVYSWSMIMWFIMALEPPFGFYTESMICDRVFRRGSRPAIFTVWPESVAGIMKRAWDTDISARPSFMEISLVLKHEIIETEPTVAESIGGSVGSYLEASD